MNNRLVKPISWLLARRGSMIHYTPIAVMCTAVFAGWLIYTQLLVGRGPFYWDESLHAMQGVLFAHSIEQGNWLAFLFDSYRQVLYPPLYAWLIGLSFLVMGHSIQTACLVSLVGFVLTVPVLYASTYYLREDNQAIAGGIASILFLGAPILISFTTQVMTEIIGLFFLSVTILIYLKIVHDNSSSYKYTLLGLAVAFTYFARIQYGVLVFIAIVFAMILEAWLDHRSLFHLRMFYFLLPLLFIFGFWFAYPAKFFSTLGWLINTPNVSDPYSLSGWLFYPQATVRLAGSLWMFILYFSVISICVVRFGRERRVRFLLVIVGIQIILGIFHHNRQDRYLLPILPSIFLLTGFVVAEAHRYRSSLGSTPLRLLAVWGLPLFIILHSSGLFLSMLREPPIASTRNLKAAAQIAQIVQETSTSLVIATRAINEPSPPLLDWYLIVNKGVLEAPQAGSVTQIEEERRLSKLIEDLPLSDALAEKLSLMFRADTPGKTRTIYLGLPERASYSQSSQAFDMFFQKTFRGSTSFQGVIVITVSGDCGQYCLDYITPAIEKSGLQHIETIPIEDSKLLLDLYKE